MALTATFQADFKSFTDACAKAQVSLKGIETGAGNVEGKLTRMSDSLNGTKIIQQAAIMAEAVERVGGVSALTEKELAKVGATAEEASQKLQAMGQQVPPAIQKIADAASAARKETVNFGEDIKKNFSNLGTEILKSASGFAAGLVTVDAFKEGIQKAAEFVKESIGEYLEAEKAQRKLTAALEAQGTATPAVIGQFKSLTEQFKDTTVHSGNLLTEMEALLVEMGDVAPKDMEGALKAASDLSAGLGIELRDATVLVGKAFEDNFGALKKAGVQIDETKAKAEGMTYVLGQIEARFGGQAQAEVNSYAGQLKQLENNYKDLQETVGQAVVSTGLLQDASKVLTLIVQEETIRVAGFAEALKDLVFWERAASDPTGLLLTLGKSLGESLKGATDFAERGAAALGNKFVPAAAGSAESLDQANKALAEFNSLNADNEKALRASLQAFQAYNAEVQKTADKYSGAALASDVSKFADALKRLGDISKLSGQGQQELAKDLFDLQQKGALLNPQMLAITATYLKFTDAGVKVQLGVQNLLKLMPSLTEEWKAQADAADKAEAAYNKLLENRTFVTPAQIRNLPQATLKPDIEVHAEDFATVTTAIQGALGKAAQDFPDMLAKAIIHGQSIVQAFDAILVQIGSDFGEKFGQQLSKAGGKLSGILGNIFGPLGAIGGDLLGKGIGKLVDFFKGGEGAKVNDLRDSFIASRGGLQALQKEIADFGNDPTLLQAFNKLYNTGKVNDFNAAVQALIKREQELGQNRQDLADAESDAMSKLDAAVQKYGFSIDELGPKFRAQKLQEQAEGLIEDYNILIASGIENGTVTAHMTDAVNDYIHAALRTGTEIPEAMKPMLEKMADMGELTDDAGNKITDLTKLNFSTTLTKGFQSIVDKLDELIRRLVGDLPKAADTAAGKVNDSLGDLSFDIPIHFNVPKYPDLPDGIETAAVYPQALGGDYIVRRPTLFLAGEAGKPERVTFGDQRGITQPMNVTIDMSGSYFRSRDDAEQLAQDIAPHLFNAAFRLGVRR